MSGTVLIAMDDSENARRAVSFVAKKFSQDHNVILLTVMKSITSSAACELDEESLSPYFKTQQKAFCLLEEGKEKLLKEALARAKQILVNAGFPEENIETRLIKEQEGIARDIVRETEKTNPDCLVMGRRGLSGFKGFFLGSVSQKVLQLLKDKTVVLVQ